MAPTASTAAGSGTGATDTVPPVTSWSKPVPFPYTNVPVLGRSENTIVSAAALAVLGPGPARAQSSYFLDVYHDGALVSGSATPVLLQPGTPVTFTVYLREQVPTGGTSGLATNDGLFGGGVRSGFNNTGAGPLHLPEASAATAIQVNPGFATVDRAVDATSAGFQANVGFTGPPRR